MNRDWTRTLLAVGILAVLILAGLQAQNLRQGPGAGTPEMPGTPGTPGGAPARNLPSDGIGTPVRDMGNIPEQPMTVARLHRRVTDAARSVDGVVDASASLNGRTALVGVTLEPSIAGQAEKDTKDEVAEQVRELPDVDKVAVTTNPLYVAKIKQVYDAVISGKTVTAFERDLEAISDRLNPR